MPIYNNNYVAPVWINDQPPAINQTEMLAMSQTIQASQILTGYGAPTQYTTGVVGQRYADTSTNPYTIYRLVTAQEDANVWELDDSNGNLALDYDPSSTYLEGRYCIHEGKLYRATTNISTPESWTPAHWQQRYLADDVAGMIGLIDKPPRINSSGYWEVWDANTSAYVSTGYSVVVNPPMVANTASEMTNHGQVYVYNGNESGYQHGYWYYWNGTAWTAGAAYQVAATDKTLTVADAAADAKATGDAIGELKSDLIYNAGESGIVSGTWYQGTLGTLNGLPATSSTRIYMGNYTKLPRSFFNDMQFTVPAGFKMSLREYNGPYTGRRSDWLSGTFTYYINPDYYYRFVLSKSDDSAITPADAPSNAISYLWYEKTDDGLSKSDMPADAKVTGDAVGRLNNLTVVGDTIHLSAWAQGTIGANNGVNGASATRVRSLGFQSLGDCTEAVVHIPDGLKIAIREFSSHIATEQESSFTRSVTGNYWETGEYTFTPVRGRYYRFVAAYTGDGNILPTEADLPNIYISCNAKPINYTSAIAGGSLVGNVSVRAAKTHYFSDGTPPYIEWYLLEDFNGKFYRSKDLIKKEYLFTFFPPISTAANWSFGIDANNNIFIIMCASAIISDQNRLNDSNRVNPFYYLASENYSVRHTLDFGSAKKPAGWLSNTGWLVLPDGDIIMCEYTRGCFATCNVWHVDGADTTDVSNWTAAWSHEIIDTTEVDVPGMKHCHCVQYDYFHDICYFGTGDSDSGSYIYHSVDHGETWTLTYGPNKNRCRQLNFVFTKDNVYWASDSWNADDHHFFVAERDQNHVIDVGNATEIALGQINKQACYGCAYIQRLGLVVMMDRQDSYDDVDLLLRGYDIASGEIVELGTIKSNGGHTGFRTTFIDWYPRDCGILIGFNFTPTNYNVDVNTNLLCGNPGGITGDGSTRINNLIMYVGRNSDETYSLRFSTIYV